MSCAMGFDGHPATMDGPTGQAGGVAVQATLRHLPPHCAPSGSLTALLPFPHAHPYRPSPSTRQLHNVALSPRASALSLPRLFSTTQLPTFNHHVLTAPPHRDRRHEAVSPKCRVHRAKGDKPVDAVQGPRRTAELTLPPPPPAPRSRQRTASPRPLRFTRTPTAS